MEGVIFIGLQASGKSTFYIEYFFNSHLRISLDMLNTRRKENEFLKTALELQQRMVIDNTNPMVEDRKKYISQFKQRKYKTIGYYFKSELHPCLERNRLRHGKQRIPDVGLYSTLKKMEQPTFSEGFDELYYVEIKDNKFIINKYKNEV